GRLDDAAAGGPQRRGPRAAAPRRRPHRGAGGPVSGMFSALKVRNYRIYAIGALISNTGTWMGRVAQDWVVLTELTDHSASALGIVTGLQFLPIVLLTPVAGALSDAFSKRKVMMVSQSLMALFALAMGIWVMSGHMQLWHMYLLALL